VLFSHENGAPTVALHHNRIVSNTAVISGVLGIGGGLAVLSRTDYEGSVITLTHNLILSNTAVITNGHGLGGGLVAGGSRLYLDQNRVAGNVAVYSGTIAYGGGFYLAENEAQFTRNVIRHNQDGGLVLEGGVTTMENTAVIDNQGDGLYLICNAYLDAAHLTIARNMAPACTWPSHLIVPEVLAMWSTAVLTNTILAGHSVGTRITTDSRLTLNAVLWHDTPIPFQAEPGAQVTLTHQHFGNPLFAADGYHITAGSAARFRGLPAGVMVDIDGQPRPSTNPALGADEYWLVTLYMPIVKRSPEPGES
jgi:hypothetical protein